MDIRTLLHNLGWHRRGGEVSGSTPKNGWTIRRWIRYGFLAWALFSTAWLLNSFRTQGVDHELLISDAQVSVQRSESYLAFIPTSTASPSGLVFIVGGGVAPEAYAPMLRPIAANGHATFLVALPYRIAPLESHKIKAVNAARAIVENRTEADQWVIAGHSLGGALACRLARESLDKVIALVLLGTSHPKTFDLSSLQIPVTKVVATNDGVATLDTINSTRHLLPHNTRWITIQGGNHSQFGHYGHQLFDGTATISRNQQQEIAREALLQALSE